MPFSNMKNMSSKDRIVKFFSDINIEADKIKEKCTKKNNEGIVENITKINSLLIGIRHARLEEEFEVY